MSLITVRFMFGNVLAKQIHVYRKTELVKTVNEVTTSTYSLEKEWVKPHQMNIDKSAILDLIYETILTEFSKDLTDSLSVDITLSYKGDKILTNTYRKNDNIEESVRRYVNIYNNQF